MFEDHRKAGNGFRAATLVTAGPSSTARRPLAPAPLASPEDRRLTPRFPFTALAEALDAHSRTRMNARTSDLGKGGCYVDTFSPFPLKTGVRLRITKEKSSFVADAKVVYSKIGMGMGLQFTSIEPQQMTVLDKWLGELNGTAPLEIPAPGFDDSSNGADPNASPKESGFILNELLLALMRKGILTEEEGKAMVLRLAQRNFLP
ncbi:MAG: PilZ domain-containing protein [Candidatus Acidiferrum sp.]